MSGTSADGIDAILLGLDSNQFEIVDFISIPMPLSVRREVLSLIHDDSNALNRAYQLSSTLSLLYSQAVNTLTNRNTSLTIRAIGCHGQTLRHFPNETPAFSIQIVNGAQLAQSTNITTIVDFRSADICAGGQGAPLAPGFHQMAFASIEENRGVLNLGGIANLTFLPNDTSTPVTGFDSGPANTLLDLWAARYLDTNYDVNGEWSQSGQINTELLQRLLYDPYFSLAPPKSTGREYFNDQWLKSILADFSELQPNDVQATLVELTAISIANDIKAYLPNIKRLIICGGGTRNTHLVERIKFRTSPLVVETSKTYEIGVDQVEAAAFAWLAYQRIHNLPGNIPSVTGANEKCILGAIYEA